MSRSWGLLSWLAVARLALGSFPLASGLFGFGGFGVRRITLPPPLNDSAPLPLAGGALWSSGVEWAVAGGRQRFLPHLETSLAQGEFYYLVMGDSQYWFPCTPDNTACMQGSNWCVRQKDAADCSKRQNVWANDAQQASVRALVAQMRARGIRPKGFIINGDLTDFGHGQEFRAYKDQFGTPFQAGVKMYPGLGNHDYANNVDDCFDNLCADRMANEMRDVVEGQLRLDLDLRHRKERPSDQIDKGDDVYSGSLAYSWETCGRSASGQRGCVHFVQLHNYPTYETAFRSYILGRQWRIRPSLNWLRYELERAKDKPVLLNFHKYDGWDDGGKEELKTILQASNATVIGMLFAHFHSMSGLHPESHWCIKGAAVPLLYSGSVPGSKYSLLRLSPFQGIVPEMNVLSVLSKNLTQATSVNLPRSC